MVLLRKTKVFLLSLFLCGAVGANMKVKTECTANCQCRFNSDKVPIEGDLVKWDSEELIPKITPMILVGIQHLLKEKAHLKCQEFCDSKYKTDILSCKDATCRQDFDLE